MKIAIENRDIRRAQKVMNLIIKALRKIEGRKYGGFHYPYASVNTYQNGRENGFSILLRAGKKERRVTFSEAAASDQVVVYPQAQDGLEYSFRGGPTDEAYDKARYFDTEKKAADFCVRFLTK